MPKLGRWPLLAVVALLLAGVYQYMASIESIKNVFPFLSLGMVPGYAVDEVPNLTGKVRQTTMLLEKWPLGVSVFLVSLSFFSDTPCMRACVCW